MKHFMFLKTVVGKGFFNLFCASMFLVGNNDEIWGYIMTGTLAGLGLLYILIGCSCVNMHVEGLEKDGLKDAKAGDDENTNKLLN